MKGRRRSLRKPSWAARSAHWLSPRVRRQVGAIPYAESERGLVFLLVTSRRTGRWIFPKGGLIAGLDGPQSAAREAYEEAGVEGAIGHRPVGCYLSRVRSGHRAEVCLYPLQVDRLLDAWPEKSERRRLWADLGEAEALGMDPHLLKLAGRISRRAKASALSLR